MTDYWIAGTAALWLGILTSISPCPLATNVAAISYVGKRVDRPRHVLVTGVLYTFGRAITYVALGVVIVAGAMSVPQVANFLQIYMNKVLGPILVITGMFLVNLLKSPSIGGTLNAKLQDRAGKPGIWGAALLGMLFALSFCPTSAALFFGSLIPLSLKWQSRVLLPSVYGIGTAIPVVAFAILLSFGTKSAGNVLHRLSAIEPWVRRATGTVFIVTGIYLSLTCIFGVGVS